MTDVAICRVPGCGAPLRKGTTCGVCARHLHGDHCRCRNCMPRVERQAQDDANIHPQLRPVAVDPPEPSVAPRTRPGCIVILVPYLGMYSGSCGYIAVTLPAAPWMVAS